jgi:integrase/recombinase XerD
MLTTAVDWYLAARRAAGFQLSDHEGILRDFARFAAARGDSLVRAQTVVAWARSRPASPFRRFVRLRTVRHFARHLQTENTAHEVPPAVFGHPRPRRRPPTLFTPEEIQALVGQARDLPPVGQQPPLVYSTLFGLLASTGLRISEALALRLEDVTTDGLIVRHAKFGKSRVLPLHPTTQHALRAYLDGHPQSAGDAWLFLSRQRLKLRVTTVRGVFRRLVRRLKIGHPADPRRPRLHDLRFYFANQVLATSPDPPTTVSAHLLALTTYLGHSDVRNSYWYLEATPAILARLSATCEAFVTGGQR